MQKHMTHSVRDIVVSFLSSRIKHEQPDFHAQELRNYVSSWGIQIAPGTPDRVLRMVRRAGLGNYRVRNRANSLYRALPVAK